MLHRIKQFWKRQRLKTKFLFISIPSAVFSSIVIMVLAFFIFQEYEKNMYSITVQNLNMIIRHMENEMAEVDDISVSIVTDSVIQRALKADEPNVRTREMSVDAILLTRQMYDVLVDELGSSGNIISISIFVEEEWYYVGDTKRSYDPSLCSKVNALLPTDSSELLWYASDHPAKRIYGIRSIKDLYYNTFEDEAMLVIEYDLQGSIQNLLQGNHDVRYSPKLAVFDGQQLLYSDLDSIVSGQLTPSDQMGYSTVTLDGNKYFTSHLDTSKYGWSYAFYILYDDLFGAISLFRMLFLAVVVITLLISIVYCEKLTAAITNRFFHLTERMKSVQEGDFQQQTKENVRQKDELEVVCERFEDMVGDVDRLIQDNYVKQMLIRENQLKVLQNQINPHFLFNTLQAINWMAKEHHQDTISQITEALGKLLRYTLREDNDPASLADETAILLHYITIQKIRYQERLDVTVSIPKELMEQQVPKLALQNIVENSIKYALENMLGVCHIQVSACSDEQAVYLRIEDNGPGIRPGVLHGKGEEDLQKPGLGIGLNNIRERIYLLFPEGSDLILTNTGNGTLVEIRLLHA